MIGRRATVGLALLCALVFCAFVVQSTSAAKGITAVTCAQTSHGFFTDAHCDTPAPIPSNGSYEHVALPTNPTLITITNAGTANNTTAAASTTLKGTLGGVASEIVCQTITGNGVLENKEGPPMSWAAVGVYIKSNCKMPKPVNGEGKERCKVGEPIEMEANIESKVISEAPEEMSANLFPPKEKH